MAYKKLIKVSNVCQVLDKRTYPATGTNNGITFAYNGDGGYTANGTFASSDGAYFYFCNGANKNVVKLVANHKYLVLNGTYYESGTYSVWLVVNNGLSAESNGTIFGNDFNAKCYTPKNDEEAALSMRIVHKTNVDTINFTFKPQLFDLTEMYGAGHEPTTVAQFRQDFPDEIYDYSPHCWLTSYKRVFMTGGGNYLTSYQRNLTCKTKNLFDISSAKKVSGASSFSKNGNQITVSHRAGYSNISANVLLDTSLVGKTVTFSAYAKTSDKNTAYLRIQWLAPNGLASTSLIKSNNVSGQEYQKVSLTGVIPAQPDDEHNNLCLSFYSNGNNVLLPSQVYTVVYTDIQLELGDTATDYVPYGHL